MADKRVTLKDIALAANVSIGTVDRAVNGKGRINAETQRVIMQKVHELNYRPNKIASTLRRHKAYKIALVIPDTNHFFRLIIDGAKKACEDFDDYAVSLHVIPQDSEENPQGQLRDIAQAMDCGDVSDKYGGLIIAPLHASVTQAINEAAARGIQVVTVNMDAKDSARMCYVGQDPWRTGGIIASVFGKFLNNAAEIAVIEAKGRVSWQQRTEGFMDVLEKDFQGIRVACAFEYQGDRRTAYDLAISILRDRPQIRGIFANTTEGTIGIGTAILDMNRKGKVIAVSYDTPPEGMKLLDDNAIVATVTQNPFLQGYHAAKIMCRILLERVLPEKTMWYTSADLIVNSRQLSLNAESVNHIGCELMQPFCAVCQR